MSLHFGGESIAIARRAERRPGGGPTATARTMNRTWSCSPPAASQQHTVLGLEGGGREARATARSSVANFLHPRVDSIHAIGERDTAIKPHAGRHRRTMWPAPRTLFGGLARAVDHENVANRGVRQRTIATVGARKKGRAQRYGAVDIYKTFPFVPQAHPSRRHERHLHEAGSTTRPSAYVGAHMSRPRRGRSDPGHRHRRELSAPQGPVRRHHRHPPDCRRGFALIARSLPMTKKEKLRSRGVAVATFLAVRWPRVVPAESRPTKGVRRSQEAWASYQLPS